MLAPTRVFDSLSNTQSPSRVRPGRALWFQEAYSRSSVSIKCTGSMMRRPSALGAAGVQQGLQHFLVCQGRRDLPAQRHDADAVGNAPAQTAHRIIAVAALAGDVFLGYGAVGAGQAQAEETFPGGQHTGVIGQTGFAGGRAVPPGEVKGGGAQGETRGTRSGTLRGQHQKARRLGLGERVAPEVGAFKQIPVPGGGGD